MMKARVTLLLASAGILGLAACAPTDGTTTTGMSRTAQGAIAGAAAGAIYGAQRDNKTETRDVLRSAAVGAAAGAAVGAVLDQQERALRSQITNPNIRIVNNGSYLSVIMPEGILFATDSAAVSGAAQNDLYALARNLNQYPNSRVEVIGHTDSTGTAAYNLDLSERRARSVAGILTAAGVAQTRLAIAGRGQAQPIASNNTAEGRAQNRRVEINIRPTQ